MCQKVQTHNGYTPVGTQRYCRYNDEWLVFLGATQCEETKISEQALCDAWKNGLGDDYDEADGDEPCNCIMFAADEDSVDTVRPVDFDSHEDEKEKR